MSSPVPPLVEFMVRNCHCFALRWLRPVPEAPTFAEDFPGPAARAAGAALSLKPSVFTEELAGSMPGGRFGKQGSGVQTADGALEVFALHGPSMFKEEPKATV